MIERAYTYDLTSKSSPNSTDPCPRITIGITCFNAALTIERALESALNQDWPNVEVVVVDDGSTDGSREILARSAGTDGRLRVVEHPQNHGCAAARNTLVDATQGDFLAFFDDDDVSRPERLSLQYDRIVSYEKEAGTQLVACYASGQRVYPNGYIVPIRAVGADGSPPIGSIMADYLLFNKQSPGVFYGAGTPTCSMMARTSVFRVLGGFDTAMRRQEDIDIAIRLSFKGGHFIGISQPVLTQYATSGSEKSAQIEFESCLQLLEKNAVYLIEKDSYRYMRLWSEMRYRHFAGQDLKAAHLLTRLLMAYPLRTLQHFFRSATRRIHHERSMNASA